MSRATAASTRTRSCSHSILKSTKYIFCHSKSSFSVIQLCYNSLTPFSLIIISQIKIWLLVIHPIRSKISLKSMISLEHFYRYIQYTPTQTLSLYHIFTKSLFCNKCTYLQFINYNLRCYSLLNVERGLQLHEPTISKTVG